MTGKPEPTPQIEARLDELLDDLAAGRTIPASDDPELQGLTAIAQALRDDDQLEWPEDTFPDKVAASIYAQLHPAPMNGRTAITDSGTSEPWNESAHDQTPPQITSIPASDTAQIIGASTPAARLRRIAQIAAAIAGFGLLTLVLIMVFRGFGDGEPAAIGTGDSDRPPQIAVTMQTDPVNGNPDIFLVSLDGSDPVNLTDNPANDTMPAWSPDGSKIAFISDRSGEDAIYIMEADGSYVRELDPFQYHPPSNPEVEWHYRNLAWSPDGSIIAAMRYAIDSESEEAQILMIDAGGTGYSLISMNADFPQLPTDQTPVWSSDSRWLLFEVRNEDESRMAVSGRDTGYLVHPLPASGNGADWSADGELAIATDDGLTFVDFVGELSSPSLVSDEFMELPTPESGAVSAVKWSPDESHVALISDGIRGSAVWIASRDGSELTEIPASMTGIHPAWSPDGSQIAFLRAGVFSGSSAGYDLMLYDTESASITLLADTGFSGPLTSPPVWRPNSAEPESDPAPTPTPTVPENDREPTPSGVPDPEDILYPPEARLHTERGMTEGYYGSYSWQFSDPDQSYVQIDAPIVTFTDDPITAEVGEQLAVSIRGEEFTRPPERTTIEVYDFDDNQTFPTGPSGQPASEPAFSIQTEPVMSSEAEDPAAPELALDVPPGRYALVVRSDWGPHPVLDREIHVTWVFDVDVSESTPTPDSSTDPDEPASSPTPMNTPLPPQADPRVGSRSLKVV